MYWIDMNQNYVHSAVRESGTLLTNPGDVRLESWLGPYNLSY
jgi:hypothetical protein